MRTSLLASLALTALIPVAGCGLYFQGSDPPPDAGGCAYGGDQALVRNPQDGACQTFDYGNPCNPSVGLKPAPDWAFCGSTCEALAEGDCLATPGCRAAYTEPSKFDAPPAAIPAFYGCWGTAPSGPIETGACDGLDAQSCSQHDNCAAFYSWLPDSLVAELTFDRCAAEPSAPACNLACTFGSHCELACGGCGDTTTDAGVPTGGCTPTCVPDPPQTCDQTACMPGSHCQLDCLPCDPTGSTPGCMSTCTPSCVPDALPCDTFVCGAGSTCYNGACTGVPVPNSTLPPPGTCAAYCIPDPPSGPGDCIGPISCESPQPLCPSGTVAGIANGCYTGYCIPILACGPTDPGTCDGPVACTTPPPACSVGSTPGIVNGCYSGYCIPAAACPPPVPLTCDQLATEAACQGRPDCTPIYQGNSCTCTSLGCTCQSETYERCTAAFISPPPSPTPLGV
jgi:hypothetical protein